MSYTLPKLPYSYDALEPFIDQATMKVHHQGHHQAYINNLTAALDNYPTWQNKTVEELLTNLNKLPQEIQTAVKNNAGGHYNHSLLWKTLISPKDFKEASNFEIGEAINQKWGNFENFKQEFMSTAAKRFGSGFAWLVLDENKELQIISTPNQDNPISNNQIPLFGVDVWEHAYYLKYQNLRPKYLKACFNVLNWEFINQRFVDYK